MAVMPRSGNLNTQRVEREETWVWGNVKLGLPCGFSGSGTWQSLS